MTMKQNLVVELTGIRNTDLLGERPLSVVLNELLTWVDATTQECVQSTGKTYFPGISYFQPSSIETSSKQL